MTAVEGIGHCLRRLIVPDMIYIAGHKLAASFVRVVEREKKLKRRRSSSF